MIVSSWLAVLCLLATGLATVPDALPPASTLQHNNITDGTVNGSEHRLEVSSVVHGDELPTGLTGGEGEGTTLAQCDGPLETAAPVAPVVAVDEPVVPAHEREELPQELPPLEPANTTELEPEPSPPPATAPEFLSFAEWRDKYAALPESNKGPTVKANRKKAPHLPRLGGTTVDGGDGTELGGLFPHEAEREQTPYEPMVEGSSREGANAEQVTPPAEIPVVLPPAEIESRSERYPLQPLVDVGTNSPSDPLCLLKDRTNYALADCAAKVHRSSPQSKGASSILSEKKDRYMLTPCSAGQKFVELELCDEIRIDTIVLGNYEFFSSMFKLFSIKVSMHYPGRPDEWQDLGVFRARNARGVQVFSTNQLGGWYRYMRIDFLAHYSSEFYCPVSLLRVYGITQMDKYRQEQEEEADNAAATLELAVDEEDKIVELVVAAVEEVTIYTPNETVSAVPEAAPATILPIEVVPEVVTVESRIETLPTPVDAPSRTTPIIDSHPLPTPAPAETASGLSVAPSVLSTLEPSVPIPSSSSVAPLETTPSPVDTPLPSVEAVVLPPIESVEVKPETTVLAEPAPVVQESASVEGPVEQAGPASPTATVASSTASPHSSPSSASLSISVVGASSLPPSSSASPALATSATPPSAVPSPIRIADTVLPRAAPRNDTRAVTASTPAPHSGDSIYGTIMKRLSGLEHNQTMAMNYIEAQSSMIRDAFSSIERRLERFEGSRAAVDESVHAALVDLVRYRSEMDRDRLELTAKLNALTQEVLLERRIGVAQLLGLLALFVFVGVTRGSPITPFLGFADGKTDRSVSSSPREARRIDTFEERRDGLYGLDPREANGEALAKFARFGSTPLAKIPARRFSSAGPKTAPRRHHATVVKPRPWTPPLHDNLDVPDDPFASSTASRGEPRRSKSHKGESPSLRSLDGSTYRPGHSPTGPRPTAFRFPPRVNSLAAADATTPWTEVEGSRLTDTEDGSGTEDLNGQVSIDLGRNRLAPHANLKLGRPIPELVSTVPPPLLCIPSPPPEPVPLGIATKDLIV